MEKDLNKIAGIKPKFETQYINLTKLKSQVRELNEKLEKKISDAKQEKQEESKNGRDNKGN